MKVSNKALATKGNGIVISERLLNQLYDIEKTAFFGQMVASETKFRNKFADGAVFSVARNQNSEPVGFLVAKPIDREQSKFANYDELLAKVGSMVSSSEIRIISSELISGKVYYVSDFALTGMVRNVTEFVSGFVRSLEEKEAKIVMCHCRMTNGKHIMIDKMFANNGFSKMCSSVEASRFDGENFMFSIYSKILVQGQ